MFAAALALHLLFATAWVGGMFFAYHVLRPVAADRLEPPERLALWRGVFHRFFPWVWLAAIGLPVTGYGLVFGLYGGLANVGWHVHLMQGLGWLMILLFAGLFFGPWRTLREALDRRELPAAGAALNRIRRIVGVNLLLGAVTVAVAGGGRLLPF
ncbi:MAG: CopD family protein [Gammaproteobacteria bacterium]|nr:CopD family protein [Gammaproteobacteria bacterium]